jgi:hypothetical protein
MKDEYLGWLSTGLLLIALVISLVTNYVDNKHKQTIIKTNIGEFMLRDGKMYGVYELTRDVQGNMVTK